MNNSGQDESFDGKVYKDWPKNKLNKFKRIIPFYSYEELAGIMNCNIEEIQKYSAELAIKPETFHEKKRIRKKRKPAEKVYTLKQEDSMDVLYLNDRAIFKTYDKKRMDDFIAKKNILLS